VARGTLQPFKCNLQNEAKILVLLHNADRTEAVDGVVANKLVNTFQLLVSESEIGLARRSLSSFQLEKYWSDDRSIRGEFALPTNSSSFVRLSLERILRSQDCVACLVEKVVLLMTLVAEYQDEGLHATRPHRMPNRMEDSVQHRVFED
jgi:hypothetical protein